MGGESYEVVVMGPAEATAAATARLGAQLARSHNLPVAAVVRALSEKNLRIAEGLDWQSADSLVQQLQTMGALTAMRRSTVAMDSVQSNIPTPMHGFPAAGSPAGHTLQGLGTVSGSGGAERVGGAGLAPLAGTGGGLRGISPLTGAGGGPSSGLRPLGSSRPERMTPSPTPTPIPLPAPAAAEPQRLPTGMALDVPSAISSFALPETPRAGGQNPFSVPDEGEQALELDIKPRDDLRSAHPSHSLAGASALNTNKIVNTSSASGLSLSSDDALEDTIRCPTHGLLYDRRKAAGCRRCLEAKRSATRGGDDRAAAGAAGSASGARAPARSASPARRSSWVTNLTPARRAFLGLFLALGLGFGAAVYYTLGPVAGNVGRLRAEQTALSSRPGTQENLARFDQIESDVGVARTRGIRNSLILWVAASGLLLAGWYKTTS